MDTPLFALNSRFDRWQLANVLFAPCIENEPYYPPFLSSNCSKAEQVPSPCYLLLAPFTSLDLCMPSPHPAFPPVSSLSRSHRCTPYPHQLAVVSYGVDFMHAFASEEAGPNRGAFIAGACWMLLTTLPILSLALWPWVAAGWWIHKSAVSSRSKHRVEPRGIGPCVCVFAACIIHDLPTAVGTNLTVNGVTPLQAFSRCEAVEMAALHPR